MSLANGTKLGPYEIISPLGAGGMGEVYRAEDTRLDRQVAIKVLPDQLARDQTALNRFEREAKAIAALSHPNVLAVFDVGRENETSYVVTELLEGQTLRQTIRDESLPWRKAVEVGCAVADGLAAAHGKGITHRDLKPENIFLTDDGIIKILDFGLARMDAPNGEKPKQDAAHTPTVTLDTRPGTIIGTLNYMSPEQLRGKPTDPRTDIFSFGCVLYEMITGERAFKGETSADTMTSILRESPPSIRETRQDVGPELERVIDRCLEKKPEQRFHSTSDLAFTLRSVLADSGIQETATATDRSMWGFGIPIIATALTLAAIGIYMGARSIPTREERTTPPPQTQTKQTIEKTPETQQAPSKNEKTRIAVLPFEDTSPKPTEWFAGGMTEAVTDDLAAISALKVTSYTSVKQYKARNDATIPPAAALNVDYLVAGSVLRDGDNVSIRARLLDAKQERIWSEQYERDMSNIIALQQDIAKAIADSIEVKLTPNEKTKLESAPIVNPEAYEAYMRGMSFVRRGTRQSCESALKLFDHAIEKDSDFAIAHVGRAAAFDGLANNHLPPIQVTPKGEAALRKAIEIDDNLADAHALLGKLQLEFDWNWNGAKKSFDKALSVNPSSAIAHLGLATYFAAMGRSEEAIAQLDMVQELDASLRYTDTYYGAISYMARDFDRSIRDSRSALEIDPDWWAAHLWLGQALSQTGQHDEAIKHAKRAAELNGGPTWRAMLGGVYAVAGNHEEALEIYNDIKSQEEIQYACPYEIATIPLGLSDFDTTFMEMNRACQARSNCLAWLQVDPRLDPIRKDPRFDDLLERVGFEPQYRLTVAATTTTDKKMIAVLPFKDLSPKAQEWFSDGMTDAVISNLAKIGGLRVISRTSVMRFKATRQSLPEIARKLNADYIVEGSVVQPGNRIRITASLMDGKTEEHVWSETYDRQVEDVLDLQGTVARAIAEQIQVTLTPDDLQQLEGAREIVPEAHEEYLKGLYQLSKRTEQGYKLAVESFTEATRLDPNFALAYAKLADAHLFLQTKYLAPFDTAPYAKKAAIRALEIDPNLAEAHAALGEVKMDFDWKWDAAEAELTKAIELNPSLSAARLRYAEFLAAMSRPDECKLQINAALELDPMALLEADYIGMILVMSKEYDLAIKYCKEAIELDPAYWGSYSIIGLALQLKGDLDGAIENLEIARQLDDTPLSLARLGTAYAHAGRIEDAKAALAETETMSKDRYVCPYHISKIHIGLEDNDQAFTSLNQACVNRSDCMKFLEVDPELDPIRDDKRFDDLLLRVGFEPKNRLIAAENQPTKIERIMLAVLPFDNMTPGKDPDYFTDGMTDEMITRLGRLNPKKLGVIARTSAMRYKGSTKRINEIGNELGVQYILEGGVRKAGDQVRISATLIQVNDQTQLWTDSYRHKLEDVFDLQSRVADAVATALTLELLPDQTRPTAKAPTTSSAAYDAYLLGRSYWAKRTPESLHTAIDHFKHAIELDPNYALAFSGLADAWTVLPWYVPGPYNEMTTEAMKAAEKAYALDDSLAESHASMASVLQRQGDSEKSDEHYRKAIDIDPNNATAHQWYGQALAHRGRFDEAIVEYERSITLDPLSAVMRLDYGGGLRLARRWEQAIKQFSKALELQPKLGGLRADLTLTYLAKGDHTKATATFVAFLADLGQSPSQIARFRRSVETKGMKGAMVEWLGSFRSEDPLPYNTGIHAELLAWCGEKDLALEWLERAIEHQDPYVQLVEVSHAYDNFRDDPRYKDLLTRIGTTAQEPTKQP